MRCSQRWSLKRAPGFWGRGVLVVGTVRASCYGELGMSINAGHCTGCWAGDMGASEKRRYAGRCWRAESPWVDTTPPQNGVCSSGI
ncbi:hypothetical protein C8F01DRAFT_1150965 [Mycena amicta]|nr:hypothetical protein C8F01DRAFT_1150965 [Mycena amicta]